MNKFTDTSEKDFQKYIVKELVEQNKFRESVSNDFEMEFCVIPKQLWEFIEKNQPENAVCLRSVWQFNGDGWTYV